MGVSYTLVNFQDRYLRHISWEGFVSLFEDTSLFKQDATFVERSAGLAAVKLQAIQNDEFVNRWLTMRDDGRAVFVQNELNAAAILILNSALSVPGLRLIQFFHSGRILRHRGFELWWDAEEEGNSFLLDSTFIVRTALVQELLSSDV
ncbi:MAG: AbfB domain-containing protein [Planctomycetales bacterium]|nr:AbfB domain-containing protein [Planctomycetales bacterium]